MLLVLPILIIFCGFFGVFLTRKNILLIFMSIEIMLAGLSLFFILESRFLDDCLGEVIAIFIIALGAAEVAFGLAILIILFRLKHTIAIEKIKVIRGRALVIKNS